MRAFLQVYNLFDYYFCEFQQHICMSLVALLFIETLTSIFNLGNFEFTHQRYRQVIIDIVIDLCCLVLPSLATITRDFTFMENFLLHQESIFSLVIKSYYCQVFG